MQSVTITVSAVNDPPVRTSGSLVAIAADEDSANDAAVTLGLNGLTYGPGGGPDESGQAISYQITAIPSYVKLYKTDGATEVSVNGTVTAAELAGLKYKTLPDGNGTDRVIWMVTDNGSGTAPNANCLTESLSLTVNELNDAPVRTGGLLVPIEVNEDGANDTPLTLGLAEITYEPGGSPDESGQTLYYQITAIPSYVKLYKADGLTEVRVNTTVSAESLAGLKFRTLLDANGTGSITWTVTDSGSDITPNVNCLTESLSITVKAVNDAPVRRSGSLVPITVDEDSANDTATTLGLNGLIYSPGGALDESGQAISYQMIAIPTYVKLYKADGATDVRVADTLAIAELASLKYKTLPGGNGTESVTWTVTDSGNGTAPHVNRLTESLSLTVNEVNVAPVLGAIGGKNVNEQASLNFSVTGTDQDQPVQGLTYSLDEASIDWGMTIDARSGQFTWAPTEFQGGGSYQATITVTDDGVIPCLGNIPATACNSDA